MRNPIRFQVLLLTAAVSLAYGCNMERGRTVRTELSIGTAGTGGLYYPIGGSLADRLSARDTIRSYSVEVTGGSVENIQRVMTGEMGLGFAIGTTVFEAYTGGQGFDSAQSRLRVVAPLYPNLTHLLIRNGSGIESVADLRGRRVSVGAAGSGTEQVSKQLLGAFNLDYESVDERFLTFSESAAALVDGTIDAAVFSVGYTASAVLEAMSTGRVRLLPIDQDHIRKLVDRHAYYSESSIPAFAYPGQDQDVTTISVLNWIVARNDLEDDVVVQVLDILAEEIGALSRAAEIAGQINLANLYASPTPLHPAARDWVERGAESASRDSAPDD